MMHLHSGTIIAAESTNSAANPLDKGENVADLRRRLALTMSPNTPKLDDTLTGGYHWLDEY